MAIVEGLLVNGVTEILKKLVGVISNEISPLWNVRGDLKTLEKTLEMILAVISDAENRQVNENSVKLWLKRLRDVVYDADDVLDEFAYELMRRDHIMNLRSKRDKVRNYLLSLVSNNPLVFNYQMTTKIKTINTKLDAVTKDMASFGFDKLRSSSSTSNHLQWDGRNNTDSYGDDSEINVERDNDISHIVGLLIDSHDDEKVSVVSMVGMGGIGKTTLAQRVYNHETVTKHFDLKIWVYVSDRDIVVDKVLKDILASIPGGSTSDTHTTDVLVRQLREKLNGKKYLLVLDDFWDKDIGKWASLKSRLVVGAQGSKILVTTRSIEVASNVRGAISPYILQQISDEGCWSIIKHRAFSPGGAQEISNMIDLGKSIASKCGGLPLAAQTLGSLMHNKNQQNDWLKIKDMGIMTILESESRIKEILKLSYDYLSPNLKQCFSYCSIFPRGWEFERKTLVQLWIAEGFVPSPMEEEEGNNFFNILVNNSLLQTHSPKRDKNYKMHDLIYDLAQSVSENNEFLNVKVSEMDAISNKEVRRLGVVFDKKEFPTTFPKKLHTFLTFNIRNPWESNRVFSNNYVFTNKYLRILDLSNSTITSSPLSFAKLKHLRYLNLSNCSLQVHDLNISALYNLQTLLLEKCWNFRGLPNDIGALKNLRHLALSSCGLFEELPKSICTLSNLQFLYLQDCYRLQGLPSDIGNLKCLRVLNISKTRIKDLPDSITGLTELTELDFQWTEVEVLPNRIGDLKLRKLNLKHTKIRSLPESCTSTGGLCNLEEVNLGWYCQLPKYIGNWTNLRSLKWSKNYTIGTMLGMDRLTRLERLDRYDVSGSHCAVGGGGIGDLGSLNLIGGKLMINCLMRVRGGGIEEAKRANLREKSNITFLILNWQGPHSAIDDDDDDVDENGRLDEDVLEGLQPHSNVKKMDINGYKGSKLPAWMTNLAVLILDNCNGFQQLQDLGQLPHLKKIFLHRMKNLEEWIEEEEEAASCYFPMLFELVIKYCPKLITFPTNFPCLVELTIEQVNAKVLNINNITSLEHLDIEDVPQLEFLSCKIFHPRLKHLVVKKCPTFQGFIPHIQDIDLQALERIQCLEFEWLHPQSDSTKKVLSKLQARRKAPKRIEAGIQKVV